MFSTKPSLNDYFEEFCNTTGVRGFSFIKGARHPTERLVWATLVIFGIVLTIWDCTVTTNRYISKPTSVRTTVNLNRSMDLGKATLCIDIDVAGMRTDSVDLYQPGTVRQFLSGLRENFDLIAFLQQTVRNNSIADSDKDGRIRPLLVLSTAVLGAIVRHESLSGKQLDNFTWSPPRFENEEVMFEDNNSSYSIYLFYEYLMLKEVNITAAVSLVSVLLCRIMKVEGSVTRHVDSMGRTVKWTKPVCELSAMTWLEFPPMSDPLSELICLKISNVIPEFFDFHSTSEYSDIIIHPNNLYQHHYHPSAITAYIDFSGSIAKTHMSSNVVEFPLNRRSSLSAKIQMIGHFKQLSTARFRCSSTGLFSMCRVSCRIEFIRSACNCTPVSAALFHHQSSVKKSACSQLNYNTVVARAKLSGHNFLPYQFHLANCTMFTILENPATMCAKNCLRDCETRLLSLYAIPYEVVNNSGTILSVAVDPFLYPYVEEFELIDLRQYLGSLGGNLSLWLGASFIVLLHLVVFILKILIQQGTLAVGRRSSMAGSSTHTSNSVMMIAL